jgi:hypothetical protein
MFIHKTAPLDLTLSQTSPIQNIKPNSPPSPEQQRLLIIEASRSHSDTPHSVELLWSSDQPKAEISTCRHKHSQKTSMLPAGFEPAIPASERPQTHALASAATGIGTSNLLLSNIHYITPGLSDQMMYTFPTSSLPIVLS